MPHINTGPGEHDFTASAYIVRIDEEEPRLLLHKHKLLSVFLQFGGHIEKKENLWQAVTHEILDEAGYDLDQLSLLQPKSRITQLSGVDLHPLPVVMLTHPFNNSEHFHTDIAWAFTTHETPKHQVGQGESNGLRLFSRQELLDLPAEMIPQNVREIGLFVLDICLKEWESVPVA